MSEATTLPTTAPSSINATKVGKNLAAGALARCCAATAMYPIDAIKTRLQFQRRDASANKHIRMYYSNGFSAFKHIIRDEGFFALYRGLPVRLVYITPAAAVSFTVYEQFMTALRKRTNNDWVSWQTPVLTLCAGAAARVFGTAMRTPFDILKQQLQVEGQLVNYGVDKKGIVGTMKNIFKAEGLKGYFAGYGVTLLRDAPFAAIYFTSYELIKMSQKMNLVYSKEEITMDRPHEKSYQHLIAGASAGAIATCCTIPIDVVKTRLQTQSKLGTYEYTGVVDCFKKIYQTDGWRGFLKGLGPRLAYIMPASALTFTFYEKLKILFKYDTVEQNPVL